MRDEQRNYARRNAGARTPADARVEMRAYRQPGQMRHRFTRDAFKALRGARGIWNFLKAPQRGGHSCEPVYSMVGTRNSLIVTARRFRRKSHERFFVDKMASSTRVFAVPVQKPLDS